MNEPFPGLEHFYAFGTHIPAPVISQSQVYTRAEELPKREEASWEALVEENNR